MESGFALLLDFSKRQSEKNRQQPFVNVACCLENEKRWFSHDQNNVLRRARGLQWSKERMIRKFTPCITNKMRGARAQMLSITARE
jgi:hypothetical protein